MRVLIFSADQTLSWLTDDAVAARGWSLLSSSNLQELQAQAGTGVNAVVTTPAPPGIDLSHLNAELKKWNPVPALVVAVLEEKGPAESLEQYLGFVDRIIVAGKSVPKQPGDGKILYCRATALGDTLVRELGLLQSQTADAAPKTAPAPSSPSSPADVERKRPAMPRDKRALLERTCPYDHRMPAVQAALNPAMQTAKLFVDTLTPDCGKPVLRCPSCNASNRSYGRYCRYCGSVLEFAALEESLYQNLKVEGNYLSSRMSFDAAGRFQLSSINAMTPHKGFLWIGGGMQGGGPALVRICTGERPDYFLQGSKTRSDKVVGIQHGEFHGLPVLVITTRWAVYRVDLNPLVKLNREPLLTSSPEGDFQYPAVMVKDAVVALEHLKHEENEEDVYYLRGSRGSRKIGPKVSGLIPVHSDRVLLCTPDQLWLYDAVEGEARSFAVNRKIEVDNHPIAYDSRKQKAYVKTKEGICVAHLEQKPWLEMCVRTSQPNYAFCLSRKGDSLWVHDDNYVYRYSTADFRQNFDSRSLQIELPFSGTPPVEQGGLLFVSTRWGPSRKYQLGVIDPRIPRFWPGEDADEMADIPPRFSMGAAFLPVKERGRLCLKRYFV